MKKIIACLFALLSLLQVSVAFADIPSPYESQQSQLRRSAEELERKGISIENVKVVTQESKSVILGIELNCPEGGQLDCLVINMDNERLVGKCQERLNDWTKRKNNNFWIELPINTDEMLSGKNELEINCSYQINYELIKRLGGGYAWFKAGRPMKKTAKSVSKETTKRIVFMKTKTRYFVYEV